MSQYVEIIQHPTLPNRIKVLLNSISIESNYKEFNPLKSSVYDVRVFEKTPNVIQIIFGNGNDFMLCAYAVFNPETMINVIPVEKVNNVYCATNVIMLEEIEKLLV